MNKPTRIIEPPWYDTCPKAGKKAVIILTDAGEMTLAVASELTGVDKDALWYRVIRCGKDAWKDEDIFDQERAKRKRKLNNTRRTDPIGNGKPGKPITGKIGTWERRADVTDRYRREQTIKALPGMDQDYASQCLNTKLECSRLPACRVPSPRPLAMKNGGGFWGRKSKRP